MKFDSLIYQYFRQLKSMGTPVTIRRVSLGSVDPESGVFIETAPVEHDTVGVLTSINQEYWQGVSITTNEIQAIISAESLNGFKPGVSDRLEVGETVYMIKQIKPIAPAGKALAYRFLVTK